MSKGPENEHETTRKVREFYEQFKFPGIRPWDRDGIILLRRIRHFISGQTPPVHPSLLPRASLNWKFWG
jgi:hypothetical protein